MNKNFKIDNKTLSIDLNLINQDKLEIKSSPYNYFLKFINEKELINVLSQNNNLNGDKDFIFIDNKVYSLYEESFFSKSNYLKIKSNEKNKTIYSSLKLIDFLNEKNFTKKEKLISIGGGITQDVTALGRAIFKRGITWIYFPTTLLSMSDSCIGAKSAINYGSTKNLLGLFSAPKEIYIYTKFLETLNNREILSGYGEIIKLCIIGGESTLKQFESIVNIQNNNLLYKINILIKTALLVKMTVICEDEFENDIRKALNYGHTIGHAIEPLVNFKIPHGISVSIGMYLENMVSNFYGHLDSETCIYLNNLILKFIDKKSLKYLKNIELDELINLMKKDKKNEFRLISFAVPSKLGHFKIIQLENDQKLRNILENSIYKLVK